ncbi:YhjD/YihY/BrkB family envelope integrity protein [Nakamurella sp. GG22]
MTSAPPPTGGPTQRLTPAAPVRSVTAGETRSLRPSSGGPTPPGTRRPDGASVNGSRPTPAVDRESVDSRGDARGDADNSAEATAVIHRSAPSPADSLTVPWHRHGTGPMPLPVPKVRHRWRKIFGRTLSKAWADSLFGMSSQAAFWCALSTAPLLLALLGMIGFIVPSYFPAGTIDQVREQVLLFLNTIFNEEVADNLVGDTVNTILRDGQADVVSIGLIISLWAGSSAMSAFVESITIAYNQHEVRHPVTERFFALGLYLVALLAGIVLLPLLAIGPDYLPKVFPESWRAQVADIVNFAYYPVLALGLIFMLTVLYKVAPKHKHPWYRGVPGALVAAAVFIVASFGLRLYLSYVYSHGLTYGALATPITFLLFYYFVSMAIIIGAQFNNAMLEFYPPRLSKREQRKWNRYSDPELDPAGD